MLSKKPFNTIKLHLIFMPLYIFAVYVPYLVCLSTTVGRDILRVFAVSNIGWLRGHMNLLILYIVLTFPFSFYQFFLFNRNFLQNDIRINITAAAACASMAAGALIPIVPNPYARFIFINALHLFFSIGGAVVFLGFTLLIGILFALKTKYKKPLIWFLCVYHTAVLIGFAIMGTAAAFQLTVSLNQLLLMTFIIALGYKNTYYKVTHT